MGIYSLMDLCNQNLYGILLSILIVRKYCTLKHIKKEGVNFLGKTAVTK